MGMDHSKQERQDAEFRAKRNLPHQEAAAKAAALAHLETNQALCTLHTDVIECLTDHPRAVDHAEHQLTEACDATRTAALALWFSWKGIGMPLQDAAGTQIKRFNDWLCKLADEHDLPFE